MIDYTSRKFNVSRILIFGAGLIFILSTLLYNEVLLALFDPDPPISSVRVTNIREIQFEFLFIGFTLIVISDTLIRRISWVESLTRKNFVTNILLAVIPVLTIILMLELSLRPFVELEPLTTIFMRDSELGWKLKPNTKDLWCGVPVVINAKGLRGRELSYAKLPGIKRILYLGDSVTFGPELENDEQTFPYVVEKKLKETSEYKIETINSGVDGYSPWQEYIFLKKEGIKYNPDLIIVSFVLNDVLDKYNLAHYGGEGWQLFRTVSGEIEKFLVEKSSIVYFIRRIGSQIRFGSDIRKGAKYEETMNVWDLTYDSDRPDFQEGWKTTLLDLGKIFEYAKSKNIPVMIALFPFTFQFEDIENLSNPQNIVKDFAIENKIPVIDLLPELARKMEEDGTAPEDYFLDEDHLSVLGCEVVAEFLVNFIEQEKLLTISN